MADRSLQAQGPPTDDHGWGRGVVVPYGRQGCRAFTGAPVCGAGPVPLAVAARPGAGT